MVHAHLQRASRSGGGGFLFGFGIHHTQTMGFFYSHFGFVIPWCYWLGWLEEGWFARGGWGGVVGWLVGGRG